MIKQIVCPALSVALKQLKRIICENERSSRETVVFCEDRLTLAAERTVCAAVGGTFSVSVYTFARFLSSECGRQKDVLSSQGSAMAIRRIIEENKPSLKLFGRLSASAAAGAVYDTVALLYASKISAEDVKKASAGGLLESKLHDIAVIYSAYEKYLDESGRIDRNAYLSRLPDVISGSGKIARSEVVFLGFQSFTRSALDCVKAAFSAARSTYGLFIGGGEEIYVNEASAAFSAAAEEFGGARTEYAKSTLIPEAEALRRGIFDPESFYVKNKVACGNVRITEAADFGEELEFIAASIKKHVLDDGERYAKISVMLPDVAGAERDLSRVFSQYRIPYYADRRHVLSEHSVCPFVTDYLECVSNGCAPASVDAVVSSPFFPAEADDKDAYRNYALRFAVYRGGIKREPKRETLENAGYDFGAVQRVREIFLKGLSHLPARGGAPAVCAGIRRLLTDFGVQKKLDGLCEKFRDDYPTAAQFSGRVYEALSSVLDEAEVISGSAEIPLKEFIKILKSGFNALEISLIPPKADAVFVGDVAATANTGSNVVFAACLTGDVPSSSPDTALLSDREIAALEKINIDISPKIRQVNMRRRELTALNICAFKKRLYLSYPVRLAGEECGASEIISYASALFATPSGAPLKPVALKKYESSDRAVPYYCSEKLPALKRLLSSARPETLSAIYSVLSEKGFEGEAHSAVRPPDKKSVSDGKSLFVSYNSVSPTVLETYFLCPYRNFMQQGLKLKEREEGAMRPLDAGNFIHAVLQNLAPELNGFADADGARSAAEGEAEKLLQTPTYSPLCDTKSGEYAAAELIKEAGAVSAGAFEQLYNSAFKVERAESKCEIPLVDGVNLYGRIDRVDGCGEMVRVIDYKTGAADASPAKYYMGLKLQLPLYLTAASKGRRAVGAYYFPASVEYKSNADGVFRLQGFMDGGDDVVALSDTAVEPEKKSAYFDAYLGGKRLDAAMDRETFGDFLKYSSLVARQGTREMLAGNVTPSPAEGACAYCKMGGSCGFAAGADGAERKIDSIKCAEIAEIVRKAEGDK